MRRAGKFYINNEKELMRQIGLNPTAASGAGWLEKEDGQNEYIICQLKSTDANSYRLNIKDIKTLEANAAIAHKTPMFLIQFLKSNDCFVVAKLEDISTIAKYIETGSCEIVENIVPDFKSNEPVKIVKSSKNKKREFWNEKEKEREKWQKNYKSKR